MCPNERLVSAVHGFGKSDKQHLPDGFLVSQAHCLFFVSSITNWRVRGFLIASAFETPKQ